MNSFLLALAVGVIAVPCFIALIALAERADRIRMERYRRERREEDEAVASGRQQVSDWRDATLRMDRWLQKRKDSTP